MARDNEHSLSDEAIACRIIAELHEFPVDELSANATPSGYDVTYGSRHFVVTDQEVMNHRMGPSLL